MTDSVISILVVKIGILITYIYPLAPVTRILKDAMVKCWSNSRDVYGLKIRFRVLNKRRWYCFLNKESNMISNFGFVIDT